jgi:hypothetical protein
MSALAAALAAGLPSLAATPALAGPATDVPAKTGKAHAKKKPHDEQGTKAKKREKKTASRAGAKGKKTASRAAPEAPKRPCLGTSIALDRVGLEAQTLRLVDCHDRPVEASRAALSVLARPWGAQKPAILPPRGPASPEGELAPGVRLLDPGLLARLDAVAHRFPGRTISLVSGYRPQSRGSMHQSGRALDLRVAGVNNEELVAFCKTLADTGCGYYPNSSFVHLDVRAPGTGGVSWIDASGPGEAPRYVHRWPPPPEEQPTAAPGGQAHDGSDDPFLLDDEHPVLPAP